MATAANIAIDTGAYGYKFTHWFKLNPTDLKDEICSVYADVINNMQNKSLVIACSDGNAIWVGDVNNSIHLFSNPRNGTALMDTDIHGKNLFCSNQGWRTYHCSLSRAEAASTSIWLAV
jgi:hypothetical protein